MLVFEVTLPPPADLRALGRLPGVVHVTLDGVTVPPGGLAPFYARDEGGTSFPALWLFDVHDFTLKREPEVREGPPEGPQWVLVQRAPEEHHPDVPVAEAAALVRARPGLKFTDRYRECNERRLAVERERKERERKRARPDPVGPFI
jgi:hypothetical protein